MVRLASAGLSLVRHENSISIIWVWEKMVDENLTDEQQADIIRQWLRDNGLSIVGGLGLGLAAIFGWNQWQSGETSHAEEASDIYEQIVGKILLWLSEHQKRLLKLEATPRRNDNDSQRKKRKS